MPIQAHKMSDERLSITKAGAFGRIGFLATRGVGGERAASNVSHFLAKLQIGPTMLYKIKGNFFEATIL